MRCPGRVENSARPIELDFPIVAHLAITANPVQRQHRPVMRMWFDTLTGRMQDRTHHRTVEAAVPYRGASV